MALSVVTANEMLDHILGTQAATKPSALWLTIFNKSITADLGGGSTLLTVSPPYTGHELTASNGGFSRFPITLSENAAPGSDYNDTATEGVKTNNGLWDLGVASAAGGGYGLCASWGIVDADDGNGQIRIAGDLGPLGAPAPMTINTGERLQFPDQDLKFDASINVAGCEISTYSADNLIRLILGIAPWTVSGQFHALFHNTSGLVATNLRNNNVSDEVTAGTYARQDFNLQGGFVAAASGSAANAGTLTFPTASVDYDGPIDHHAVMEQASGANVLAWTPAAQTQTVSANVAPRFDPGSVVMSQS